MNNFLRKNLKNIKVNKTNPDDNSDIMAQICNVKILFVISNIEEIIYNQRAKAY